MQAHDICTIHLYYCIYSSAYVCNAMSLTAITTAAPVATDLLFQLTLRRRRIFSYFFFTFLYTDERTVPWQWQPMTVTVAATTVVAVIA